MSSAANKPFELFNYTFSQSVWPQDNPLLHHLILSITYEHSCECY